ncbi:MAG: hypothetical protein GWM90_11835, partial [Gemmatimonadetes bacterium]|nr:hypothetical protein [Gemmatimonadota bacterium]NIQ54685.1 hypothetical protein [Gemmatimonadota bacterium]NIU74893.1 hypothetical protein [Gammaproteobacteria bacterium]NIX44781.1 hypothetical protein [Gemmatimonadota bacterium]NIY09019.1 hypothetical protein [Gemmatimonadota bacterium]
MRLTSSSYSLIPALIGAALLGTPAAPATAQEAAAATGQEEATPTGAILSSDISVSQDAAELRLELEDGRSVSLLLDEEGAVRLNGERIGAYERRDALDRAWRDLLQRAMDTPPAALPDLLAGWSPPEDAPGVARRIDRELEALMASAAATSAETAAAGDASDSIQRLNERIRELERMVDDPAALEGLEQLERLESLEELEALDLPALRELRTELERDLRDELRREIRVELRDEGWSQGWGGSWWRHFTRGLGGVFSTLMAYAILVGLGFLAVFFGRKYLEGIADTARHQTLRSGLVGLAGSFLVLPAYILGLLALAVSIVGIPLILVFAPLFPVAVVLAAVGGYLAVAHGAGEALAERRFTGTDWFTRANSYYYVITGVGLL